MAGGFLREIVKNPGLAMYVRARVTYHQHSGDSSEFFPRMKHGPLPWHSRVEWARQDSLACAGGIGGRTCFIWRTLQSSSSSHLVFLCRSEIGLLLGGSRTKLYPQIAGLVLRTPEAIFEAMLQGTLQKFHFRMDSAISNSIIGAKNGNRASHALG